MRTKIAIRRKFGPPLKYAIRLTASPRPTISIVRPHADRTRSSRPPADTIIAAPTIVSRALPHDAPSIPTRPPARNGGPTSSAAITKPTPPTASNAATAHRPSGSGTSACAPTGGCVGPTPATAPSNLAFPSAVVIGGSGTGVEGGHPTVIGIRHSPECRPCDPLV